MKYVYAFSVMTQIYLHMREYVGFCNLKHVKCIRDFNEFLFLFQFFFLLRI